VDVVRNALAILKFFNLCTRMYLKMGPIRYPEASVKDYHSTE
jgi:hypothetical protein